MRAQFVFTAATMCLLSACNSKPMPFLLEKYCVSETGMSKYWLSMDTSKKSGTIRYQYRGQDIKYLVTDMQVHGEEIEASAEFSSSTTGETHGSPFTFTYDNDTGELREGSATAACENTQVNTK